MIIFSGGSKRGARDSPRSKFFQIHAVSGKIWQILMLGAPPGELMPPPRGNPGSATDFVKLFMQVEKNYCWCGQLTNVHKKYNERPKNFKFKDYLLMHNIMA